LESFLLTTQIILAVILTVVVLFQKSSSIGLGSYSGSNESLFGAKGANNFLSKLTFIFGALFLINTIALSYVFNKSANETVIDKISTTVPAPISSTTNKKTEENSNQVPANPTE
jgi:preprotein translocase subunit SecG